MKKTYQKPEILVENFVLSDYVAACNYDVTFASGSSCTMTKPDNSSSQDYWTIYDLWKYEGLFNSTCGTDIETSVWVGEVCYHNQEGSIQVFNS